MHLTILTSEPPYGHPPRTPSNNTFVHFRTLHPIHMPLGTTMPPYTQARGISHHCSSIRQPTSNTYAPVTPYKHIWHFMPACHRATCHHRAATVPPATTVLPCHRTPVIQTYHISVRSQNLAIWFVAKIAMANFMGFPKCHFTILRNSKVEYKESYYKEE